MPPDLREQIPQTLPHCTSKEWPKAGKRVPNAHLLLSAAFLLSGPPERLPGIYFAPRV